MNKNVGKVTDKAMSSKDTSDAGCNCRTIVDELMSKLGDLGLDQHDRSRVRGLCTPRKDGELEPARVRDPIDKLQEGSDLDLAASLAKKIRKPHRREWVVINPKPELTTRLLIHKSKADGMDTEHYFVSPDLRVPIWDELRAVRVFNFYSLSARMHALWVVNMTSGNPWYESLAALFRQPQSFFRGNQIRVIADKPHGLYKVKYKPCDVEVLWPEQSTEDMLGEALGPDRFITTDGHPLYEDLTSGKEL